MDLNIDMSIDSQKLENTTKQFTRTNKNRPQEISSKISIPKVKCKPSSTRIERRDPRFDKSCGVFDQSIFEKNYNFTKAIKKKEMKTLRKKLKDPEICPKERDSIKLLLQRMENQQRELKKKVEQSKLLSEKRNYEITQLKEGKNPFFQKKSTCKLLQLVEQFEGLKKQGSVNKHMKRQRKKKTVKDRTKLNFAC